MAVIFTICSNNYLAQAAILGASLRRHHPGDRFILFLCDQPMAEIDYATLADEMIPVANIEPRIDELAGKYSADHWRKHGFRGIHRRNRRTNG